MTRCPLLPHTYSGYSRISLQSSESVLGLEIITYYRTTGITTAIGGVENGLKDKTPTQFLPHQGILLLRHDYVPLGLRIRD